jgi:glyoxylase-like metal-dependent hydrolase (beta-lactamase superfamily II)
LIGGDLIFKGSYGRTDFPGGDPKALFASLQRVSQLEKLETILTGHGPAILSKASIDSNFQEVLSFLYKLY